MQPNVREAVRALTEKPMLSTSAERFLILNELKSERTELPQPRRFAFLLSSLLARVSTPLEDLDLIAGRCVDRELSDAEEAEFQAYLAHPDNPTSAKDPTRRIFFSSGHGTYSWETIVEEGLPGLVARAEATRERTTDGDARVFLDSILEILSAIRDYGLRYADAAKARGMTALADNLRHAVTRRPEHFAEALQLLWLITLINCSYVSPNPTLTLGRLDQILYPLYRADLDAGILSRERARDYITDYYCKHNLIMGRGEHQVGDATNSTTFDRILNFDAPQYLLLAGTDEAGALAANELTELFAECIVPAFKNPVVVVRYVPGMDRAAPTLWRTLCDRARKSASLMFYNDKNVYDTFLRIGLPPEDARRYAHFGCNWCSPGDMGAWMLSSPRSPHYNTYRSAEERAELKIPYMRTNTPHGWPEDLLEVLRELAEKPDSQLSVDEIYRRFFARMGDFIDRKLKRLALELEVRQRRPSAVMSLTDCFLSSSLDSGKCFTAASKYFFQIQSFQMFGTVADSILAVDRLVLREKRLTLRELLDAVDADFVGHEDVLALCRHADKYGMDTPLSNEHVRRLSHTASNLVIEKSRPYLESMGLFLIPCMQSDTWHLKLATDFGATPDGRRAHTPFSQNIRPSNGAAVNGLTAMLNDVLNLPRDGLVSGALNLDVDARQVAGEAGLSRFSALLASYLNRGGLHAQVSAARVEDLIDAQKNPEAHRDLRVRVTGYSGVFVDVCRRLQDDIIHRFE